MKTIVLGEREAAVIDIRELLSDQGRLIFEGRSKKYFDFDVRGNDVTIVAGDHIGLIPIGRDILIDVRPKFGIANLAKLLSVAQQRIAYLEFFKRKYVATEGSTNIAFSFLVDCFLLELQSLETRGEERVYREYTTATTLPHGKINVGRTLTQAVAKGKDHTVVEGRVEFTKDTTANRCIKHTLQYCLGIGRATGASREQLSRLASFYDRFRYVNDDPKRTFLPDIRDGLAEYDFKPLYIHYKDICKICLLILDRQELQLNESEGPVRASSFLVNLSSVFEDYVRNVLRDAISDRYEVLDGNKRGRRSLYSDKRSPPAKPDLVVRSKDGKVLIGEVKYKKGVRESDRYQVIAHAFAYGAEACVLFTPKQDGEDEGLVLEGHVGRGRKLPVYIYRYPLDSDDLAQEETKLVNAIVSILENRDEEESQPA